ncbi:MAG: T9SS type A sorting domain-containing protein [candidate division WOR-3 bacterium]
MKRVVLFFVLIFVGVMIFAIESGKLNGDYLMMSESEDEGTWGDIPKWATDSLNVRGIGRVPYFGDAYDVFIVDTFAYVCMGKNLVILNISNKTNPQLIGYIDLPNTANGVYVSGSYAYVVDYDYGLRIINISNPSSPTEVGYYDTPGYAYGVYVSGSYAYVADYDYGLRIINISNPSSPKEVGYYDTPGYAYGVYVSGSYAYVADGSSGLRIIDISNPSSPTEVGYYDTPGIAYDVYVSGSYAYVADGSSGLRIIDISNPSNPTEVGYYDTAGGAYGVYVSGSYAYVADEDYGLRIINIGNPSSPTEVGYYNTPGDAWDVYVSGSYAYVADEDYGLRIINISNPSSPTQVGYYDTPGWALGVYVSGSYAYLADWDYGLRIINISNPSSPTEVGYYNTPGYAWDVYVSGSYAYVADEDYGLRIINISNPSSPTEVGYYDTPGWALGVYVSGSYAYVADEDYGLRIINISNPSSPTSVGYYDTPGYAYDVYVSGSYAYVADDYDLRIIDISNPSSPTEVGYYDTPGYACGVYVSGSYAYVADYDYGLRIINISNPTSPTEVGYYDTPGYACGVYVSGSYAYVADEDYGLRIINISNPTNPTEVGYYNTPGSALGVYVSNSYIYLADGNSGFYILQNLLLDTIPPSAFNLISPSGNITDNTPTYTWNKSYDTNFKEYRLYVNGSLKSTTTDTTYTEPTPISDGQYIWYVTAVDSAGNVRQSSQVDTFILDVTKPPIPILVSPGNNSISSTNTIHFTWRSVVDNYSGIKRYELMYDEDSLFGSPVIQSVTDTTYTAVLSEGRYYWKVRAVDNFDNVGDWSLRWSFEYDGTAPVAPVLISPKWGVEVEDSLVLFDWGVLVKGITIGIKEREVEKEKDGLKGTKVYYEIEVDTSRSFGSVLYRDTVDVDSVRVKIVRDDVYYWRVRGYDEAGNVGSWGIDSFELDIKIPVLSLSKKVYEFGDLDTNRVYNWRDLYIKNIGDATLTVDSVKYSDTKFFADTTYIYPLTINPGDSVRYGTKAFSLDTGVVEGNLRVYTSIYSVKADTVILRAHFGKPLRIDSAIAFDGSVYGGGIDEDDYVVLYFNQSTNGYNISSLNIDDVLRLSNGHKWTDGIGMIDTAYWDPSKTTLMVQLSTTITPPTISVGDTIYPDSMSIIGTLNSFRCHYPMVIRGSFVSGLEGKDILGVKGEEYKTYLEVKRNEIIYSFKNEENEFVIYDILGKVMYKERFVKRGLHRYSIKNIATGIYFVKMRDKDKEINKKIVIMK